MNCCRPDMPLGSGLAPAHAGDKVGPIADGADTRTTLLMAHLLEY
jgi:hypothetical protein